jgi:hypothetical protein
MGYLVDAYNSAFDVSSGSNEFRKAVTVATVLVAREVLSSNRAFKGAESRSIALARRVIQGPNALVEAFACACASAGARATSSDEQIVDYVRSVWEDVAGGSE